MAGVRPVGVVSEKRLPQGELSPAVPPAELMQTERMLPMVLICSIGTVVPAGTPVPGDVPVAVLTSCAAWTKAAVRASISPEGAPIAVGEVMNGARG